MSFKLTPQAQCELQVYYGISQSDIGIMQECETLRPVWSKLLQSDENQMKVLANARRNAFLNTDKLVINEMKKLYYQAYSDYFDTSITLIEMFVSSKQSLQSVIPCLSDPFDHLIQGIHAVSVNSCLKEMFIDRLQLEKFMRSLLVPKLQKDDLHRLHQFAHNQSASFDLSSHKIWYAIALLMNGDYKVTLRNVNHILSTILPFVLYETPAETSAAEILYVEEFENSDFETRQRAQKAWMFNMEFTKSNSDSLPLAIQIELYFCHVVYRCVRISPFICLYYLLFLCYHKLQQYEDRDRALRQLERVANDDLKNGLLINKHHAYNIAGHCLLVAEEKDRARDMFRLSHWYLTIKCPSLGQYNSAMWYIQNFC